MKRLPGFCYNSGLDTFSFSFIFTCIYDGWMTAWATIHCFIVAILWMKMYHHYNNWTLIFFEKIRLTLWLIAVIWWHKSGSILAQVMASCLTAPSHYLNQCWQIISEVLWHLHGGNFTEKAQDIYPPYHDEVIKWKHIPCNWPFVRGIHRSRWIPHAKASDAELWCFLWSAFE